MSVTRKDARQAVAALLATITDFEQVFDHEPADFGQLSPVCMVHSDGTSVSEPPVALGCPARSHALLVSNWWRRVDTTEDSIDDLSATVLDLLEATEHPLTGGTMTIDEDYTVMDYPIIDGVQYRREQIRVLVW